MPCACAGLPCSGDEGRQVLRQPRLKAGHRVRADAHELVHARQSAEDHPVAEVHMAGQLPLLARMVWLPTWQSCAMCT